MSMRKKNNLNQLSLPFGQGRSNVAVSYEDRARFFWFVVAVSFASLFIYFYSIESTARNVALRQNLESRVVEASGHLGTLEFEYIELKNNVSMELARHYGFTETINPLYVSREANSLTLNTEAR